MARSRKSKSLELTPVADPRAPLDAGRLLAAAQGVLELLTRDLLARADESPAITAGLKARHQHDKSKGLTADNYAVWRRHIVVQIAATWLLSCVFVRTLEDRGLLARNRLAGPGALDAERAFAQLAPHLGLREYLLTIFAELDHFPAARRLFDREHNLAWRLAPSPEGAKALVALFRGPDPEQPHFRFGQASTRFLGDLYQDLSEEVRKRYALLQTPDFVEEFILDRTLEPAIVEFGLPATTIIDPTCGSGHFLLGAFERLFNHWSELEPGESDARHVEKALEAVHGVDVNPYAVFIAEFRLTLAALDKLGIAKLREAPVLPINVVVADSLLHGFTRGQAGFGDLLGQEAAIWRGDEFALEDEVAAKRVLGTGFTVVVGNPPYITVKDKALRELYREIYEKTAYREYSLSVPFMQRFFELAGNGGFVGQITANSFMKREFGKKLIEEYLPTVDLQLIVNTSGAFIPGHGTPTVMLFGRGRKAKAKQVRAVLARRGEPSTPEDPAQGLVWSSIRDHWDEEGYEDEYITVAAVERNKLGKHPWSLEGGGAAELKALIEDRASTTLGDVSSAIGFSVITGEDNVLLLPDAALARRGLPVNLMRRNVIGQEIRDWTISEGDSVVWPYSEAGDQLDESEIRPVLRLLWNYRTSLKDRKAFGVRVEEKGIPWWGLREVYSHRMKTPLTIGFAFVATHNHFVLDRGGKVFKQSAPIIKLPEDATEDDHLALLAYLNSSTACFWMKQVCSPKGMHNGSEANATPFLVRFEFDGTKLSRCPIPNAVTKPGPLRARLIVLGRRLDDIASKLNCKDFDDVLQSQKLTLGQQADARDGLRCQAVATQEAIDFLVYEMFGFIKDPARLPAAKALPIGYRPFEVLIARGQGDGADATWFQWLELSPPTDLSLLTAATQKSIEDAIAVITSPAAKKSGLSLLESGSYKRRWRQPAGKASQHIESDAKVLREQGALWLENRIESIVRTQQTTFIAKPIVENLERDAEWRRALLLLSVEQDQTSVIADVLQREAVPFTTPQLFTDPGLEKHALWQQTWALQRREDAGETIPDIPVPPKYAQKDYRDATYWRLRGKLDVPKERFISYPHCESDLDPQPLYGWAGWNHAQRAEALLALYNDRKDNEAWTGERLTPILLGIHELIPWIEQWHNETDDETGERLGDAYQSWLSEELRAHGLTREDLQAWRPTKKSKAKKKKAAKPKKREPKPKA